MINFYILLALTPPSAAGARPAALSSLRSLFGGLRPLFGRTARTHFIKTKGTFHFAIFRIESHSQFHDSASSFFRLFCEISRSFCDNIEFVIFVQNNQNDEFEKNRKKSRNRKISTFLLTNFWRLQPQV